MIISSSFIDLAIGLMQAGSAVIAAFISANLWTNWQQSRQKISIILEPLGPYNDGAKAWHIEVNLNKLVEHSKPIICYLGESGNKFISYKVYGSTNSQNRVGFNEQRQLVIDVSFLSSQQNIKIHCYLSNNEVPKFFSPKGSPKFNVLSYPSMTKYNTNSINTAKLRIVWILSIFIILSILSASRIFIIYYNSIRF